MQLKPAVAAENSRTSATKVAIVLRPCRETLSWGCVASHGETDLMQFNLTNGDSARAARVGVAERIAQDLHLIRCEVVLVEQHDVPRWAARSLDSGQYRGYDSGTNWQPVP